MLSELIIFFGIGALYGLAISSLILTLIDRKFQKQQQQQQQRIKNKGIQNK